MMFMLKHGCTRMKMTHDRVQQKERISFKLSRITLRCMSTGFMDIEVSKGVEDRVNSHAMCLKKKNKGS